MCGIVGIYLKSKKYESSLGNMLSNMLINMGSRGPDSAGFAIYKEDDEENRLINRLYFVLSTLSTTGYGDVTPKTKNMKIIVMVFQFILLISLIDILSDNEYITKLFK